MNARIMISIAGAAVLATVLALAACGTRANDKASEMTSFTAGETKAETADLFTLPPDQMAHLQVSPAAIGRPARVLRFTGSVAYNAFTTTPVFSAAGGPVREILVTPGDSFEGRTQITGGLKAGERVVGDGGVFLQFQNSLQH